MYSWSTRIFLFSISLCFYAVTCVRGYERPLRVSMVENAPYLSLKNEHSVMTGDEKYQGYLVDLLKILSKQLKFRYSIHLVEDGRYGGLTDGNWSGMIGEVINGKADFALADLTMTSERMEAVDFTYPYMNVGITALFHAGAGISDILDLSSFNLGIFCCGSSKAFFENSNIEIYQRIIQWIEANPEGGYTQSNAEGVQKVLDGKGFYAYLMESASAEYEANRNCNLETMSHIIGERAYGIAFPRGSPLTRDFSIALRKLQEDGVFEQLKRKWWYSEEYVCESSESSSSWDWAASILNFLPSF